MIKNYTSQQEASRSIESIERRLARFGAQDIIKTFAGNGIEAISFTMKTEAGLLCFRVPAKIKECEDFLRKQKKTPPTSRQAKETLHKQAMRTAWKIAADWVDIQATLVLLGQAEFLQLFLSHVWNPVSKKTLFERIKADNFKAIEYQPEEPAT